MIKRILYTAGEPAGIGADLAILYASRHQNAHQKQSLQFVVIGDPSLLQQRAKDLKQEIILVDIDTNEPPYRLRDNEIGIIPVHTAEPVSTGQLNVSNAPYVVRTLELATQLCMSQQCHAVVTGPVQKSVINDAGIPFSGHTEYFAQQTHTEQVVMMLATKGLRVTLATTHLPLKDVAAAITKDSLIRTLRIIHNDMRCKFSLDTPRIAVCGLNPHAGENGHLGREEIDTIIPVLTQLREEGIDCQGPLPADTLFTPKYLNNVDVLLAMYHDQGLPVLKFKGFGAAANITLGLPIIRTSVDHGTALDLAGTGNIDTGSLITAIDYALSMHAVTEQPAAEIDKHTNE
ncbi:4-hydroxythreonine-4-phosphate dehydrogenase PdxA [Eionea flava]